MTTSTKDDVDGCDNVDGDDDNNVDDDDDVGLYQHHDTEHTHSVQCSFVLLTL